MYGPLYLFWALSGHEAGAYGYPTSDPTYTGDNISQEFERGTLRLWNGSFEGIRHQAQDYEITPADTNVYSEYDIDLNFSNYGITADPDGSKSEKTREEAGYVAAYSQNENRPTALNLVGQAVLKHRSVLWHTDCDGRLVDGRQLTSKAQ